MLKKVKKQRKTFVISNYTILLLPEFTIHHLQKNDINFFMCGAQIFPAHNKADNHLHWCWFGSSNHQNSSILW